MKLIDIGKCGDLLFLIGKVQPINSTNLRQTIISGVVEVVDVAVVVVVVAVVVGVVVVLVVQSLHQQLQKSK